jgi:opacity protein-like surface antigen
LIARTLFVVAALAAALPAAAQMSRAGRSEIYLSPTFTDSKTYNFDHGTSANVDTGFGLTFGYAYNFDSRLQAGIEFGWSEADYRTTVQPGPGNPSVNPLGTLSSTLETWTVRFTGTYNFLTSNFTPFITGGLGWTSVDTNIPSGLPESFCWYYPWYGQYCGTYVPTYSTTKFSYNAGVGLRLDAGSGVFRALINQQWIDLGGSYGSSSITQYRIDFGVKF